MAGHLFSPSIISTESMIPLSESRWERPFTFEYSAHTAFFASCQSFLLSRAYTALNVSDWWIFAVLVCGDLVSILALALGWVTCVSYLKQIFRSRELRDGPSLITEMIPQFMRNCALGSVVFLACVSDYCMVRDTSLIHAWFWYGLIALGGLIVGVLVVGSHKPIIILSCVTLVGKTQSPDWFDDIYWLYPVAMACFAISIQQFWDCRQNKPVLTPNEIRLVLLRCVLMCLVGVNVFSRALPELGVFCLVSVGICNVLLYAKERRLGTVSERWTFKRTINGSSGVIAS